MTQVLQQSHIPAPAVKHLTGGGGTTPVQRNGKHNSVSRIPTNVARSISETPKARPLVEEDGDEASEASDGLSGLPPSTPRSTHSTGASPRCEAFVMTGDKILRLDSKISPSYAQAKQDQLPPSALKRDGLAEEDTPKRCPFDDNNWEHKHTKHQRKLIKDQQANGLPSSHSAHAIGDTQNGDVNANNTTVENYSSRTTDNEDESGGHSCVTVNALCGGGSGSRAQQHSQQTLPPLSPTSYTNGFSEPGTPSRQSDQRSPAAVRRRADREEQDNTLVIRVSSSTNDDHKTVFTSNSSTAAGAEGHGGALMMSLSMVASGHTALSEHEQLAARRLAKRLFDLDGFKKSDVAMQLAKTNEFSAHVAREYLALFNFAGLRIDAALRKFLAQFCLTGESSERERVLTYFSNRYHQCNPAVFDTEDEVHTLTCALLLLNSDLHGPNLGKRMTCHEFIDNLSQAGYKFKRDLLKSLYQAIKGAQIEWAGSTDDELRGSASAASSSKKSTSAEEQNLEHQVEYKKGYVLRKCVFDENGKKTAFGRRGWRMFYATLKGLVLYLHKDEHGFTKGQYQTYRNAIKLHHAHAIHVNRNTYAGKRQHVFRLRTADMAEYLFQTSNKDEVDSWIDSINLVSASFSSPPLPAPVSSQQQAFHRPLLPSAVTRLSLPEQLVEHERQVQDLSEQLLRLKQDSAPPLNAKGRCVQQYFFRERYLEEERQRYETYVCLLRTKLAEHSQSFYTNPAAPSPLPPGSSTEPLVQMDPLPPPGVLVVSSPHHYVPGGSVHNTTTTASSSRTCSDSIPTGAAACHRVPPLLHHQSSTTSGSLCLEEESPHHQPWYNNNSNGGEPSLQTGTDRTHDSSAADADRRSYREAMDSYANDELTLQF